MPHPSTDIAQEFTRKYEATVQGLATVEAAGRMTPEAALESTLSDYFAFIKHLPETLAASQLGYTALYEIDRALEGFYSEEKVQLYREKPTALRGILIDCSALLQKFFLLPRMSQVDGRYGKLPGVDRFYARWKEDMARESAGGKIITEYERTCAIADTLIQGVEFSTQVRFFFISLLGEIVVTLGVDLDFVQSQLRNYADHIASREPFDGKIITGEVLLNLQALHTLADDIGKAGIPVENLRKALRYWSSEDEFLDSTFKQWKWTWKNDYTTPVAWGEKAQLVETSDLYRSRAEGLTNLGVGRSYLEHQEHRLTKPTELFQPIPIFVLGRSAVGKSSYFTAINFEVAHRAGDHSRKLTFGQQLQAYYDASQKSWNEGKSIPTAAYANFDFWQDVDVVGFCTYDYRGGDAEPQQWEANLQEMFRKSRGIIFMIDNEDLESREKMRARATWSRTILDYWRNSNPLARHVPVALVINKADLLIPEAMPVIKRTSLLPSDFQAEFIEHYAMSRYIVESPDFGSPLGRLTDCMVQDPDNNVHPRLQDLIGTIVEHFGQFLSRILEVTYNYQIFLISSRAPQPGDAVPLPWGVLKPLLWMTGILQEIHLFESASIYESETKSLETELSAMNNGLDTLQRLWEEIDDHQKEVEEERKKKIRFALTQREERIKHLQKLVADAEADFVKTAESFIEAPPKNKEEVLGVLRRKIKTKTDLSDGLRRRLKSYQVKKESVVST